MNANSPTGDPRQELHVKKIFSQTLSISGDVFMNGSSTDAVALNGIVFRVGG